jgi:biopolymer transport protein ExbD
MMKKRSSVLKRRIQSLEVVMEMNTTPLIDVMLVLLVMLIITIPIQLDAININLPVSNTTSAQIKPQIVEVDIDPLNQLLWNHSKISADEFVEKLKIISQSTDQVEIHLRADKRSNYSVFANVLATTKRLGITKVAIVGSEQFIQ